MKTLLILLGIFLIPCGSSLAKDSELCRQAISRPVEPDDGLRACSVILQDDTGPAWAFASRGLLYLRRSENWQGPEAEAGVADDLEAALSDLSKAIESSPREADYFALRGLVHVKLGRRFRRPEEFRIAIADFTRALELSPKAAWVFTQRARAQEELGHHELAKADYERALKNGRTDNDAREGLRRLSIHD
jgi:tetratricopeptide (TPR) repeat protein